MAETIGSVARPLKRCLTEKARVEVASSGGETYIEALQAVAEVIRASDIKP